MPERRLIFVGVFALGCGGAVPPNTAALGGVRHASRDARGAPATSCHGGRPYDRARGCVSQGFGTAGVVRHRSEMSPAFRLIGAAYALDGALLLDTNDDAVLGAREFPVLQSPLRPGVHELAVLLRYRGHGSGVFAYLSGYRFEVKKALRFEVPEHGSAEVVVVAQEDPDPTVPLEKRPRVAVQVSAK